MLKAATPMVVGKFRKLVPSFAVPERVWVVALLALNSAPAIRHKYVILTVAGKVVLLAPSFARPELARGAAPPTPNVAQGQPLKPAILLVFGLLRSLAPIFALEQALALESVTLALSDVRVTPFKPVILTQRGKTLRRAVLSALLERVRGLALLGHRVALAMLLKLVILLETGRRIKRVRSSVPLMVHALASVLRVLIAAVAKMPNTAMPLALGRFPRPAPLHVPARGHVQEFAAPALLSAPGLMFRLVGPIINGGPLEPVRALWEQPLRVQMVVV